MWNNIIGYHIRRTNRNLIVGYVLLLLFVFLLISTSLRDCINVICGPNLVNLERLSALKKPGDLYRNFVRIHPERIIDTGVPDILQFKDETTGKVDHETVEGYYFLCTEGDRALIVESPGNEVNPEQLVGILTEISDDDKNEIVARKGAEITDRHLRMLPFMLYLRNDPTSGIGTFFLVFCTPIVIFSVWNLVRVWKRSDSMAHPIARRLAEYGSPLDLAPAIDREVKTKTLRVGGVTLTQNWLLRPSTSNLLVLPLDQLAWVYKKVEYNRLHGIPVGRSFAVVLIDRKDRLYEIRGKEAKVDQVLEHIVQDRSYLFVGYSVEMGLAWRKSREALLEQLDREKWDMEHPEQQDDSAETDSPESEASDSPTESQFDL